MARKGKIPAALKAHLFKPGHIGGKAHPAFKKRGTGPKMPAAVKSKLRKRGK